MHDGVDSKKLFGTDLHAEFIDIGFELFRDGGKLNATFAAGDMLRDDDQGLAAIDGKVTLVHVANFFHLFSWAQQVAIGKRIVRFLKAGTQDAIIFGRQIGSVVPGEEVTSRSGQNAKFLHDVSTFQRLWDEVGQKTGTRWSAEVDVIETIPVQIPGFGENARYCKFGVYQIAD